MRRRRPMAKRRRDEFVVGMENQSVVGGLRLTALSALQEASHYSQNTTIYRLVPVTVAEVEAQVARERKTRKGKR